ncbi:MAG TPA: RagB/SusD family nutrient uptake outer membrane protein [Saprospiraceae bacterium]|nr:RagB/SusD family nutrient uptake outer membrane protein [Saprospiraceae bacterium]
MKKYISKIFLLGFILAATSCEDRLFVLDPNTLPPEVALGSINGFEALLLGAYNRVHDFRWYGQQAMIHPEVMADNIDFANRTGRYENEYVNAVRSHMDRWNVFGDIWGGINDANVIINRVGDVESPQSQKDRLIGQSLFIRALNYHELAKVYSYEPGQEVNGFNLSLPLKVTPTEGVSDAVQPQTRVTNTVLYDQMVGDLQEAVTLLSANDPGNFPYRANRDAAEALLARVLLYKGDFAAAAQAAQNVINRGRVTLLSGQNYLDSWGLVTHPESLFEAEIRPPDWTTVDGVNNSLHTLTMNIIPSSQFIIVASPELIASIDSESGDIRRQLFVNSASIPPGTQVCTKWRGELGDFREHIPIIRISEVYLIAAEGYFRSGNTQNALSIYNMFRSARNLPAMTQSGNFMEMIMKDRRVEFAFEGHRWFDLKRNGMDIPKTAASQQPTLSYNDFRILSFIPERELNLDDELVQNPGYN